MSINNPKKKKFTPRSTGAEAKKRAYNVFQFLIKGYSRPEIIQFALENWGVGEVQVDHYIAQAKILIEKHFEMNAKNYLKTSIVRREYLISKTLSKGEHSIALEAMRDLSKLLNEYPVEKKEIDLGQETLAAWLKTNSNGTGRIQKKDN